MDNGKFYNQMDISFVRSMDSGSYMRLMDNLVRIRLQGTRLQMD